VSESLSFEPISRETVSSQIREQLLKRITTGELAPGERVPSERELSEQFRVARTSVREAIQGLLSLGVIERHGNRTWVAEHLPDVSVAGDDGTRAFVRQLFETRRVLEAPVFALAAARADDRAREQVAALMIRFEADLTIEEFRRLDREFHTLIASVCGNPLLIELYGKVLDRLFRSHEFDALLGERRPSSTLDRIVDDAVDGHRAIADAFANGDPCGMEEAVVAHLATVEHLMVDAE
jgi:GntR family transcriptional repressor for pyruvate dehydrogenase complex